MSTDRAMASHVPLMSDEVVRDVTACVARGVNIVRIDTRDAGGTPHFPREIYTWQIAGIPRCIVAAGSR